MHFVYNTTFKLVKFNMQKLVGVRKQVCLAHTVKTLTLTSARPRKSFSNHSPWQSKEQREDKWMEDTLEPVGVEQASFSLMGHENGWFLALGFNHNKYNKNKNNNFHFRFTPFSTSSQYFINMHRWNKLKTSCIKTNKPPSGGTLISLVVSFEEIQDW